MTFTLTLDCDNAAFRDDDLPLEIERILSHIAKYVRSTGISPGESLKLRDLDGNTCGEARLEE